MPLRRHIEAKEVVFFLFFKALKNRTFVGVPYSFRLRFTPIFDRDIGVSRRDVDAWGLMLGPRAVNKLTPGGPRGLGRLIHGAGPCTTPEVQPSLQ
jgi:hypothetical protein